MSAQITKLHNTNSKDAFGINQRSKPHRMKKAFLVTALLGCLSACQKEYSCYCKQDNDTEFLVKTIKEKNKERADQECKAYVSATAVCYAK